MKRNVVAMMVGLGGSVVSGVAADAAFTGVKATVNRVAIEGFGDADVIRLYAEFDNTADKLNVVFGNTPFPMLIATDDGSPFFQHAYGGDTASHQDPALWAFFDDLEHDSFLDIGRTLARQGPEPGLSPGFPPAGWGDDGTVYSPGSWQRVPDDPLSTAGPGGRVFFAQITVQSGVRLEGMVDLTMFTDGVSGTLFGVTFSVTACPGDTNSDGVINVTDLVNVILDWHTDGSAHGGDVSGPITGSPPDGIVNVNDLNAVIVGWGACP